MVAEIAVRSASGASVLSRAPLQSTAREKFVLPLGTLRAAVPRHISQENDQIACIRLNAEYLTDSFEKSPAETPENAPGSCRRRRAVPSSRRVDLVPLYPAGLSTIAASPGAALPPLVTPDFK
jgi:hypothetical protein